MIDHYNAFISYKHAPLDNKVAAHIQSQLEHFHIPGKIRKKTGMKRIQRVFRDKDELPITSDLSSTIAHALENSDYLIVICSYSTCQSEWVKREIEYFLRNHSRSQILAVLAEGEPYEVLPEELTKEEVQVVQPDGSTATFLRDKEPLCCDYRMSFRKADKEELPRLAAALIGCSYDELMNRRRAYQMQRITILGITLTVLALGFSGFLINSRMQIQKNYEKSLRNQSIYLANESRQLLDDEKRIEAIHLALAALPSEDSDRPVTAEAIRALSDATLAYYPLSGSNIEAVWNYQVASRIDQFLLSPDKSSLSTHDYSGAVTVWDTDDHEVIFKKSFPKNSTFTIAYLSDDYLMIIEYSKLTVFDLSTSKKVWEYSGKESFSNQNPCITEDRTSFYILASNNKIMHFSVADGSLIDSRSIPDEYSSYLITSNSILLSPDEKKIAIEMNEGKTAMLGVIDLNDGSMKTFETLETGIRTKIWVSNDRLVISGYDVYTRKNMYYSQTKILESMTERISCIDFSTVQEVWVNEFEYSEYSNQSGFQYMDVNNSVAYFFGNRIEIYDCDSGSVLHSYDLNHAVIHINDNDNDGNPVFITEDGALGSALAQLDHDTVTLSYEFVKNIDSVIVGGGVYVLQNNSSQIIFYDVYVQDDEWEELDENVVLHTIRESTYYLDDDYLAISSMNDEAPIITLFDAKKEKHLFSVSLDTEYKYNSRILGILDDEVIIAAKNAVSDLCLIKLSAEDGSILETKVISDAPYTIDSIISMHDDHVTYIYKDEKVNGYRIRCVDMTSEKEEKLVLPFDMLTPASAPKYFAEANAVYVSNADGDEYIVDLETHDVTDVEIPEEWSGSSVVEIDGKGERWIIADLNSALVIDSDGEVVMELETNGRTTVGAMFYQEGTSSEMILLAFDDGALYRYDAKSGDFIGKTEIETYPQDHLFGSFLTVDDGKTLMFQIGTITDIIDTEYWVEIGVVWNSLGYYERSEQFFAFSYIGNYDFHVGKFRRYSLDDLIAKAKRIIGTSQMTDEQKSQYGIS